MTKCTLNWKKHAYLSKEGKIKREEMSSQSLVAKHALAIATRKKVDNILNGSMPLFKWTDAELGYLGCLIRKEWVRRRGKVTYEHGVKTKVYQRRGVEGNTLAFTFHKDTPGVSKELGKPKKIVTGRY